MKCQKCSTLNNEMNIVCDNCGGELDYQINKLSTVSVLLGILGIVLMPIAEIFASIYKFSGYLNYVLVTVLVTVHFLMASGAIFVGVLSKKQIKNSEGKETGSDMASTGIVLGVVVSLLLVLYLVFSTGILWDNKEESLKNIGYLL